MDKFENYVSFSAFINNLIAIYLYSHILWYAKIDINRKMLKISNKNNHTYGFRQQKDNGKKQIYQVE